MKRAQRFFEIVVGLVFVSALALGAVAALRALSGGRAASALPETPQGYPPPEATVPVPGTPYPTSVIIEVPPLQTPTPWLTFTPPPQPTRRPGPTESPMPLPEPAQDASGSIAYITSSRPGASVWDGGATLALHSLPLDKAGNPKGSPVSVTGDTELNLEWIDIVPSPDGNHVAVLAAWGALTILNTETGQIEPLARTGYGSLSGFMAWHPDSRRILYRADAGPDSGVWLVGPDDFTLIYRELNGLGAISDGAISPDGQKIIYSFWRGGGTGELRMVNADGSDSHVLFSAQSDVSIISWSPDGSEILFVGDRGFALMDSNGGNVRLLTLKGTMGSFPAEFKWSPDSRTIAYVSSPGQEKGAAPDNPPFLRTSIRLIDVSTGDDRPLLPETGNADPAWSPDGSQIAFVSMHGGAPNLWVVNVDGTNMRPLTTDNQFVRFPVWRKSASSQQP